MQFTQVMCLYCLTLVARRTWALGPNETITIGKELLVGYYTQGTALSIKWSIPPVSLWKRPIYLSWCFSLRNSLQAGHISRDYSGDLREQRQGNTILAFSPGLTTIHLPERSLYTHLEHQFLHLSARGHLQIFWSRGQQGLQLRPHKTIYSCIF